MRAVNTRGGQIQPDPTLLLSTRSLFMRLPLQSGGQEELHLTGATATFLKEMFCTYRFICCATETANVTKLCK